MAASDKSVCVNDIYHEKQVKELCALHSLNNLFQDPAAFTKSDLDSICQRLSPDHWVNPHKSVLGTGNYDINVIMAALEMKGCGAMWFDKRKDPSVIAVELVLGFILNIPSEYRVGPVPLPLRRKHWVAVRRIRGAYYNLDSKLDAPLCIGETSDLVEWLRGELLCQDKELFIVASQEVERCRSWSLDHAAPVTDSNGDLVVALPPDNVGGSSADDSHKLVAGGICNRTNTVTGAGAGTVAPADTGTCADSKVSDGNVRLSTLLVNASNVDGGLDSGLQQRLLASAEGEEAFTSPGLKFIDHDAVSVDSNCGGVIKDVRNGIASDRSGSCSHVKRER